MEELINEFGESMITLLLGGFFVGMLVTILSVVSV